LPLLRSIICLKGADNRSRYLALSAIAYIIFSLFSVALSGHFIVALILLFLCSSTLALTTVRRTRDANINKKWRFIPTISFLTVGVLILFIGNASYYLLVLPVFCSAFLLTYPSKSSGNKSPYIYGYSGPVDLSEYITTASSNNSRIEPTLASQGADNHQFDSIITANPIPDSQFNEHRTHSVNEQPKSSSSQYDIGELIRLKLLTNKKIQIALAMIITLIIISIIAINITTVMNNQTNNETSVQENLAQASSSIKLIKRNEALIMPDNFTLYLSQHQGLIINWQADEVSNGVLWSQQSVLGDKSCSAITFNKGDEVRTLDVVVEGGSEYYAHFSPLDTKTLIKALAFRGNFTLCGYKFSLKGSQAALGKNDSYGQFIDY
jgi:hypothetical protein